MIQTTGLVISLARGQKLRVPDLSIGETGVYLIAGDNGSGKTTLVRTILGIHTAFEGGITIDGAPLKKLKRREIASVISYVPQTANMEADINVGDYIRHGLYAAKGSRFDEVVSVLDLGPFLERRFNALSGGEKQLVRIARGTVADCRYTFLDEPDSFLSRKNKKKLVSLIELSARTRSIVIVSHEENPFTENCTVLLDLE